MPTETDPPVTPPMTPERLAELIAGSLFDHGPLNLGKLRAAKMTEELMVIFEPLLFSNRTVNDVRLTWAEHADRMTVERNRLSALAEVLMDLDRCEHGRHEGDACFGCAEKIAGAASMGNPWAEAGTRRIGTLMSGKPIVIPAAHSDSRDPAAWRG